ncbi:hypothetical protein WAX78_19080 [Bacillus sp. FJAT-53711]|uniref:Uncharacterized protein n=1 Tax=Bacillus yunxiaonensis TaxID=3127665 RepID=A0ABU8FZU4_9BACI
MILIMIYAFFTIFAFVSDYIMEKKGFSLDFSLLPSITINDKPTQQPLDYEREHYHAKSIPNE